MSITADDLPDDVNVLREKIAATISLAMNDTVPATLVESCEMAGLEYDKIEEIAIDCGLDPEELNEEGLGIADDPNDIQKRHPDGKMMEYCNNCDEEKALNIWKGTRGEWNVISFKCPDCGGEGVKWSAGIGDPIRHGIIKKQ